MATPVLLDCDPGHDDAIALLLALASSELDLLGVTTVAENQTLEKTTANATRVLDFLDRNDGSVAAGADRPVVRDPYVAAYVHGQTGLDGPDLPPPPARAARSARGRLPRRPDPCPRGEVTLVPTGPLTNVALLLALHPDVRPARVVLMEGAIGEGNVTPAAESNTRRIAMSRSTSSSAAAVRSSTCGAAPDASRTPTSASTSARTTSSSCSCNGSTL